MSLHLVVIRQMKVPPHIAVGLMACLTPSLGAFLPEVAEGWSNAKTEALSVTMRGALWPLLAVDVNVKQGEVSILVAGLHSLLYHLLSQPPLRLFVEQCLYLCSVLCLGSSYCTASFHYSSHRSTGLAYWLASFHARLHQKCRVSQFKDLLSAG